jgi:TRAP-type uncharacterized transport system fused permease subunit
MRGTIGEIVTVVAGVVLAMICILASFSGYLFTKISWVARIGIGALAVAFVIVCAMPDILNMFAVRMIIFLLLLFFFFKPFVKSNREIPRDSEGLKKAPIL